MFVNHKSSRHFKLYVTISRSSYSKQYFSYCVCKFGFN